MPKTSHHATDMAYREAVLLPLLILPSSMGNPLGVLRPTTRLMFTNLLVLARAEHTSDVLSFSQPSSQTPLGCLSLTITSDSSAPPHQCWTPKSGHHHATKPQIPKKGQIPASAVLHPKEQTLLLPRNLTYLPYLLSHGSATP